MLAIGRLTSSSSPAPNAPRSGPSWMTIAYAGRRGDEPLAAGVGADQDSSGIAGLHPIASTIRGSRSSRFTAPMLKPIWMRS